MTRWMILMALGQAGDTVSTLVGTQIFGADELNPLMALALGVHPLLFIAVKVLGMGLIGLIAYARRADPAAIRILRILSIFMCLVVLWNVGGTLYAVCFA